MKTLLDNILQLLMLALLMRSMLVIHDEYARTSKILAYFLAPGILVHELAHAMSAIILGYYVTDFNYRLSKCFGCVTCYFSYNYYHINSNRYRRFAEVCVSVAPVFAGILIALLMCCAGSAHNNLIDFLRITCIFSILTTCLPSSLDFKSACPKRWQSLF